MPKIFLLLFLIFLLLALPAPIQAQTTRLPDLTIKSISFDNQNHPQITISNLGEVEAYAALRSTRANSRYGNLASTVQIEYLKSDFHPTPGYIRVGTVETFYVPSPFNPHTENLTTLTKTPPNSATHVRVTIDLEDSIAESNEDNNKLVQILPNVTVPDTKYPDLKGSVSFNAQNLPVVTFTNQGEGDISSALRDAGRFGVHSPEIQITYLHSDFRPNPSYIALRDSEVFPIPRSFGPGATNTVTGTRTALNSATHVKVTIDYGDSVIETQEDNNQIIQVLPTVTTPSTQYPNLTIQSIGFDPQSSMPVVTFANTGAADIIGSLRGEDTNNRFGTRQPMLSIVYLRSNFEPGSTPIEVGQREAIPLPRSFAPNAVTTLTGTKTKPADASFIKAVIDFEDNVIETNESDNTFTQSLPTGDLIVESITKSGAGKVSVSVKNSSSVGIKTEHKQIQLSYKSTSSPELQTKSFTSNIDLAANATTSFELTLTEPMGEVYAEVDPLNLIPESNEGNNSLSKVFDPELVSPSPSPQVSPSTNPNDKTDTGLLPDSPFYFLKDFGRAISSTFTFDPVKKIELQAKFADEKIQESVALIGKGKVNLGVNHLTSAEKDLAQVDKLTNELILKNPGKVDQKLINLLTQQASKSSELEKVTGKVDGAQSEKLKEAEAKRNTTLENLLKKAQEASTSTQAKDQQKPSASPTIVTSPTPSPRANQVASASATPAVVGPHPDLIVESVELNPEFKDRVGYFIKNIGDATAEEVHIGYKWGPYDGWLGLQSPIYNLEPGKSYGASFFPADFHLTQKDLNVQVMVDPENKVVESKEDNNSKTTVVNFPKPDLIVESVELNSEFKDRVGVFIKNIGDATAPGPLKVGHKWGPNDGWQGIGAGSEIYNLEPGKSYGFSFFDKGQGTDNDVVVMIDPENKVVESNEENNSKTTVINFPKPDLIVESVELNPEFKDRVGYFIKNIGDATAEEVHIGYKWGPYDGWLGLQSPIYNLEPGKSYGASFFPADFHLTQKDLNVQVMVDPENKVVESKEDNNSKTTIVNFPKPDLIVESVVLSPEFKDRVLYVVKNIGDATATEFRIGHKWGPYDGWIGANTSIYNLAPGQTYGAAFFDRGQGTDNDVVVMIDPENKVVESNEENNSTTAVINYPNVDLVIDSITPAPNNGSIITVKNKGPLVAEMGLTQLHYEGRDDSGAVVTGPFLSGSLDPNRVVPFSGNLNFAQKPKLNPNETFSFTIGYTVVGAKKLAAKIDTTNGIVETDETNNELEVPLPPPGLPDLVIDSITPAPNNGSIITVKNKGPLVAEMGLTQLHYEGRDDSGAVVTGPFLSGSLDPNRVVPFSGNLNFAQKPKLNPNETFSFTIGYTVVGAKKLAAKIDTNNGIAETDETNNELEVPLPQVAPDLIVDSIERSVDKFVVTIKNIGILNSPATTVSYAGRGEKGDLTKIQGSADVKTLSPSESINIDVKQSLEGVKSLTALVDNSNQIPEANEDNNSFTIPIFNAINKVETFIKQDALATVEVIHIATPSGVNVPIISGLSNSNTKPCEPTYFIKDTARSVESFFTFDKEKKAKLELEHAKEKLLESSEVAADSKSKPECVTKALQSYQKDLAQSNTLISEISKKDPKKGEELTLESIAQQLPHQKILGSLEKQASGSAIIDIKQTRDKTLESLGNSIASIQEPDKIQGAVISKAVGPTPLAPLQNLEVLTAIEEHLPEAKKNVLSNAKTDNLKEVKAIIQSIPKKQQTVFSDYVKQSGGEEVNYLKIFDAVNRDGTNSKAKATILQAKEGVIDQLDQKLQSISTKDAAKAKTVLSNLDDGTMEDLRVLSDIEDKVGQNNKSAVTGVKKDSTQKLVEGVKKLNPDQKKEFINNSNDDFIDVKQLKLYQDLSDETVQEDKELVQSLETDLTQKIKEKVAETKNSKFEREDFLERFVDEEADSTKVLSGLSKELDKSTADELVKAQIESFSSGLEYLEDGEIFDEYERLFSEDSELADLMREYNAKFFEEFEKYQDEWEESDSADYDDYYDEDYEEESEEVGEDQEVEEDSGEDGDEDYDEESSPELTNECPDKEDFVCGDDGTTYINDCDAKENGAQVAYKGECKEETSSEDNSPEESEEE